MSVQFAPKTAKDIQAEYDRLFIEEPIRDEDRAYRWFAKTIVAEAKNPNSVIDIACGGGYFFKQLKPLLASQAKIVGIDISPEALKIAKRECPEAEYHLSEAEKLPFGDNTFDAITCLGSLEHFLDIGKAVEEMKRILKPQGLILILVPNIFWYKDLLSVLLMGQRKVRNQTQERFMSLGEWKELLEDFGLSVPRILKYNGIAKSGLKQWFKDLLIPTRFSYHFVYLCQKKA